MCIILVYNIKSDHTFTVTDLIIIKHFKYSFHCFTDDGKGKWPHAGAIDAACAMGANVVEKVRIVTFLAHICQGFQT